MSDWIATAFNLLLQRMDRACVALERIADALERIEDTLGNR